MTWISSTSPKRACALSAFTESVVEEAALAWLERDGWHMAYSADIAPATGLDGFIKDAPV